MQDYALADVPVFREGQRPAQPRKARRMSLRDIESMDAEVRMANVNARVLEQGRG